ncbi:MAG: hypothetical protein PVJ23_10140 [Anaerolineae bacterium]
MPPWPPPPAPAGNRNAVTTVARALRAMTQIVLQLPLTGFTSPGGSLPPRLRRLCQPRS